MAITLWPLDPTAAAPTLPVYAGRALRQTASVDLVGATAARPLGARSGVRAGTPATTVTATSTVWTVQPLAGALDLHTAAQAGPLRFSSDTAVTGAVTAAVGFIRKDIIYIQASDPAESDGTTVPRGQILYLAGTVASAVPATPGRSMQLAIITVPASGGGAPTVQWTAPYLGMQIIPVRNQAERDAIIWGTSESPAWVDRLDTGMLERNAGAGWVVMVGSPAWTLYSPAITNITVGAGTSSHQWRRVGADIEVMGQFTLGTGFTMNTSTPTVSLPVARDTHSNGPIGLVEYLDAGTGYYGGWCRVEAQAVTFHHFGGFGINNGAPFGWSPGDRMQWLLRYPAAQGA